MVGVLIFVVFFTSNKIAEENREHEFADDIQQAVSELDMVLYEYLMHRETRMEQQWNLKYNSIMEVLRESEGELDKRETEEAALLESIKVNFKDLGDSFMQVSVNYEKTQNLIQEKASQKQIDATMLLEERLVTQLLIISQSIFTNASRLVEYASADAKAAQELATNLTLILITIIIITVTTTSFIVARSISKSLDKLIKGAETIGKGNLKHRINIKSKDEIRSLAVSFNDMSARLKRSYSSLRQKIKELEEMDKLKDDFLNTTTHELKTPLVPIRSQTQLLLNGDYGKLNKKQQEAIQMIFRNEDHLERLVTDVLDITKIQSKKLKLVFESADLTVIIDNAIKNIKQIAEEKEISLIVSVASKMPKISINKKRILQVISNLLNNALKFTSKKGKIIIEVQKKEKDIVVSVKDTGIGVSKENLKKLFTPFFQVESGLERKYSGTGLGLSICKGIIETHGGKIWAESLGREKGATFLFTLPIKRSNYIK